MRSRPSFVADLADRFEEQRALDVAERAAHLDQDEVLLVGLSARTNSWIALVTRGITWTVAPRYSPRRSLRDLGRIDAAGGDVSRSGRASTPVKRS